MAWDQKRERWSRKCEQLRRSRAVESPTPGTPKKMKSPTVKSKTGGDSRERGGKLSETLGVCGLKQSRECVEEYVLAVTRVDGGVYLVMPAAGVNHQHATK